MSKEADNKATVGRWFTGFWGNPWNPEIINQLAAPDMLLQFSLHAPRRGREDIKAFMFGFREAFPDLASAGAADLIAEGDYVVGGGKAAARTPAQPSVTFSSAASHLPVPAARCGSPAQRYFVSRTARSRRK